MLKMVVLVVVWLGVLITHTVLLPELEITEREASALDLRKMKLKNEVKNGYCHECSAFPKAQF